MALLNPRTAVVIDLAANLYIALLMFRALMTLTRVDGDNPVAYYVGRLTAPAVALCRLLRLPLPVLLLILEMLLVWWLTEATGIAQSGMVIFAFSLTKLVHMLLMLLTFIILLDWLARQLAKPPYHPVVPLLRHIGDYWLAPLRARLPTPAGVDLSPLLAILILQLLYAVAGGY